MFICLYHCHLHDRHKTQRAKGVHVHQIRYKCQSYGDSVLLAITFLCFFFQERPDSTTMGATFGVAQAPPFSTGKEYEVTTLLPRNDQHH